MKPFVCFHHVGHEYKTSAADSVQALTGLNFSIQKHEFVAVVGPSGCGKSTLLKLMAGLMLPSEGVVEIFGKPMLEPRDEVGIVFQKPTLLPWLSVLDNVTFPLKHQNGKVSSEEKQYAMTLLNLVGLTQFASQLPVQLSGGMQQRVGIARALMLRPEILIMDEPFSALDALNREIMGFELLRIWEEEPKTVLFITHSINEAVLLADKVIVLSPHPGTMIEELPIELPRPRNRETLMHEKFTYYADVLRAHIFQQTKTQVAQ